MVNEYNGKNIHDSSHKLKIDQEAHFCIFTELKSFIDNDTKLPPIKSYSKNCKNSVKKTDQRIRKIPNRILSEDNYKVSETINYKDRDNNNNVRESYQASCDIYPKNNDVMDDCNSNDNCNIESNETNNRINNNDDNSNNKIDDHITENNNHNNSEVDEFNNHNNNNEIDDCNYCNSNATLNNNGKVGEINSSFDNDNKNGKEPYFKEHVRKRRIVNTSAMMDQLHKVFDYNHKRSCEGLFRDLRTIRSTDHGLLTQMYWECKKCHKSASIWSESKKSTIHMSSNESAVLSSLVCGTGYLNLREQLATMNIHCMAPGTYRKYRDKLEYMVIGTSEKEMEEAAEMEKLLAIEAGDAILDKDN
ncbi:GATA zinc finger domain-containing protein 15-like [Microplitis mediator]|uniref:GATA zinc finger domain-containing protein 15-like n=1 Tax=Microplitis mediator TaxID=375433 RepID=UPI00255649A1|nr:GATA zinc finger domain-containing protein 15-like [Microplitis mediator]